MENKILEMRREDTAILQYAIIPAGTNGRSFIVNDVLSFGVNNVIEIISLESSVKGEGRKLLSTFCNYFKDHAIVLRAEPMYDTVEEYEDAICSGKHDWSLKRLETYYTSCNFLNINSYVDYNNAIGFIYGNQIGKEIYERMNKKI